jgi:hypothetical protein
MHTGEQRPDLHWGNTAFMLKQETHPIIGCAFEALSGLD